MWFQHKYDDLFNPLLTAIHNLGGSGSVSELEDEVSRLLKIPDEQLNELVPNGTKSKFAYNLSWARNRLKNYGLLDNSSRGVWTLTELGKQTKSVDKELVKRKANSDWRNKKLQKDASVVDELVEEPESIEEMESFTWQEQIIEQLQSISPASFERLCQRLLRELGFQNVEVTGKTNDGGIDGKGLFRFGGVLSFNVIFQAKRWKGSVGPSIVRDFRGAMVGRADKGLIITTGTFTREAKKEAQRDGAPPIDLMDGNDLAEKLKELELGVEIEMTERVVVKREWFEGI